MITASEFIKNRNSVGNFEVSDLEKYVDANIKHMIQEVDIASNKVPDNTKNVAVCIQRMFEKLSVEIEKVSHVADKPNNTFDVVMLINDLVLSPIDILLIKETMCAELMKYGYYSVINHIKSWLHGDYFHFAIRA